VYTGNTGNTWYCHTGVHTGYPGTGPGPGTVVIFH
jgi:hypothetical protein